MQPINVLLLLILGYAAIGLPFAILFVLRGLCAIDGAACDAPKRVRALLVPGAVALWPVLLTKWARSRKGHA